MKRKTGKLFGLVLAVLMVVCLLPVTALADGGLTINVTSQEELTAALNKSERVDAINITQSFTVTADATIQYGGDKINHYSDTVMTVAEGVTLTIGSGGSIGSMWPSYEGDWETPPLPNAKIINNGTVKVQSGGSTVADFARNNGTITVESGGEAVCCNDNYGTVTVQSGGSYRTSQGADANNHGTITIQEGGEMESRFGSSIINCADGTLTIDGIYYCNCARYENADRLQFKNDGTVNGSGDAIVRKADPDNMVVSSLDAMIEAMMAELGQTSRFENWNDIGIFKLEEVSSYDELKAVFPGNRTVAEEFVEGDMDAIAVLTADITVTDSEVQTMGRIVVPEQCKLTVADGAYLEAGMDNDGTVIVQPGGALATTMGGNITNHGTLTIQEGGSLASQMGGRVVNNGDMTLNGAFNCGVFHHAEENTDVIWFENNGNVTGSGSVLPYQVDTDVPVNMEAVIEALQHQLPETIAVSVVPFVDVESGTYYYHAVLWAVSHGPQITNGTDETHFSPEETCTRGQVVTFLWRAAGKPLPSDTVSPFPDVQDTEAYYYNAVLWAVEKGITTGMDNGMFEPEDSCTRGQVVTFLHRFRNKPAPSSSTNPFSDVVGGKYYYDAVLWAYYHTPQITNGTDATHFAPEDICTRAQIVTFLHRAMQG